MPSWVTLACDPSGGTKVMEHGFGFAGLDWAQREAGFTEQRTPLAPDSGGITGCCTSSPNSLANRESNTNANPKAVTIKLEVKASNGKQRLYAQIFIGFSHLVQGCKSQGRDISQIRHKTPKRDLQDLTPIGGRKKIPQNIQKLKLYKCRVKANR
ncbi:hypothetical protein VNO77_29927 [Canavalia gladiata]|uniref:Uncharacterized protein n=1 Tax=Canavalia gladiata TaxID=3824 RepID=A0AAN9Q3B4_CANGL